jgi:hypothetical protein
MPKQPSLRQLLDEAILAKGSNGGGKGSDNLNVAASTQLFGPSGGGLTPSRIPLLYLDPLFDQILIIFPQDNLRELNRRLRHYYKYNPFVRSIIDFHTDTPMSDFDLRCPELPTAEKYYTQFKEKKNLVDALTNTTRDYWLLGEGFLFGQWDDIRDEYMEFVQLPPEEVDVISTYISNRKVYSLRPNKEIQKTMRSVQQADQQVADIVRMTNPEHAAAVTRNKHYPLDPNRLIVLQRSMSGYVNRGISPVLAVIKDLIFEDQLNLFRTVFIQRHSYPIKFYKLGSAEKGFVPPARMYNEFRGQLEQAINDPDFNIITHPFVSVEYYSGQDKILNLFLTYRNNLENEVIRKIFKPLARYRGFYMPTKAEVAHKIIKKRRGDDRLIVPKIYWHKANLLGNQQMQQMVVNMQKEGTVPFRILAEMFGWNLDEIIDQFKREEGSRVDVTWRKAKEKMITGNPEAAKAFLKGDSIEDILKANLKDEKFSEKVKGNGKGKKEPSIPEMPSALPDAPDLEMAARPADAKEPDVEAKPASPGELPERKPRPGEAAGGTEPPAT